MDVGVSSHVYYCGVLAFVRFLPPICIILD